MRNIFLQTPAQSNFEQRNWMTRRVEVLLGLFAEKGVVSKWMISSHIKLIKYSSHPARETFCQFTETETILRFQPPPAPATLNACCFRKNQDSEFSFRENWWGWECTMSGWRYRTPSSGHAAANIFLGRASGEEKYLVCRGGGHTATRNAMRVAA